jgi:hypothetical protein
MASSHEYLNAKLVNQLLLPMILGLFTVGAVFLILGCLCGLFGALLVYLGATHIAFFDQRFEIANLGILSLFMAGIVVVKTLQRVLKSIHDFNNIQHVNFLER